MMSWALMILAVNSCVHNVLVTYTSDVDSVTTTQIQDQKNSVTFGSRLQDATPTYTSTGSDNVRRTTVDDVTENCSSLCPAQCTCWSPFGVHQPLSRLEISCIRGRFNQSTLSRLRQKLNRLLSRCGSELTVLTITYTPLTAVPEIVCQLPAIVLLTLDFNRLTSLPSNCFTHMHHLTIFSANNNSLTSLQVSYDVTIKLTTLRGPHNCNKTKIKVK